MKQGSISMSQTNYLLGKKSVGVISEDKKLEITVSAKAMGVVASITPVTLQQLQHKIL